jgi:hypothetical protein
MSQGVSEKRKRISRFSTAKQHLVGKALPDIDSGIKDLQVITDEAWRALMSANDPEYLFQHGGQVVRIDTVEDGTKKIQTLDVASLRHEIARVATWYRIDKDGCRQDSKPPRDVVQDMLSTPSPPVPPLVRLTQVPVFAPDGSLQLSPGYHANSKTYYAPIDGLHLLDVNEKPSADEIEIAKHMILDELMGDFPFVGPADSAHAVALFLLHYARDQIPGPTPNHCIQAKTPGTGKTLLAEVCVRAALPHVPMMAPPNDESEWRRRLTAIFREAHPVVIFDNISEPLSSGELAVALTASMWNDRIIRTSETINVPIRCVWVTTGNNVMMSTEIARRTVIIQLDTNMEQPWTRQEFKHPDLRQWVNEYRELLIWAAHTLIQGWIAAGKPAPKCKLLGSYEQWTIVIGGILEHAGIPGFLENRYDFRDAARGESAKWQRLVLAWLKAHGSNEVRATALYELALACGFSFTGATSDARLIAWGKQLARQEDQVIQEFRIIKSRIFQRAAVWRLMPVTPAAHL